MEWWWKNKKTLETFKKNLFGVYNRKFIGFQRVITFINEVTMYCVRAFMCSVKVVYSFVWSLRCFGRTKKNIKRVNNREKLVYGMKPWFYDAAAFFVLDFYTIDVGLACLSLVQLNSTRLGPIRCTAEHTDCNNRQILQ